MDYIYLPNNWANQIDVNTINKFSNGKYSGEIIQLKNMAY